MYETIKPPTVQTQCDFEFFEEVIAIISNQLMNRILLKRFIMSFNSWQNSKEDSSRRLQQSYTRNFQAKIAVKWYPTGPSETKWHVFEDNSRSIKRLDTQ